jgi:hypothetical protein
MYWLFSCFLLVPFNEIYTTSFYRRSGGRGHIAFVLSVIRMSFCRSQKTLTLVISARALIFHMSIPCDKIFPWVQQCLILWPWPWCLTYLLTTLILAISFKWYKQEPWYFTSVPCDKTFSWVPQKFDLLTFVLDLLTQNFNFGYIFWMVCARTLMCHMGVSSDKAFS